MNNKFFKRIILIFISFVLYNMYNILSIKESYIIHNEKEKLSINLIKKIDIKNGFKYGIFLFEDLYIVKNGLKEEKKVVYINYIFNLKKESILRSQ
ncbi:hypothetical protein ACTS9C_15715 [Empedobacter brevis]